MNEPMKNDWSARIRLERMKRSWTQEHLAEKAKLSSRTIQRLETGADASPETVRAIAEAFGLTVEEFRGAQIRKQFTAPWDTKLKLMTISISAILAAVGISINKPWSPLFFFLITFLMMFSVRGYSVRKGVLYIHRVGWSTTFKLAELTGITLNPQAMVGSLRIFGIGGMFSYVGFYRNTLLGTYRAYATNTHNCMVLEFGEKRIVITPDSPEGLEFAVEEELKQLNS